MLKYINFITANIIKKWSVWIILALSLVATYFVVWIQIRELHKYGMTFVTSVNTYTKMMPFIFGISFMSVIVVYVFKDGEDDGSDLLVLSKPITRGKILAGKFIVIIGYMLLFNTLYFLTLLVAVQSDTFATSMQMLKFAVSVFVGGVIVTTIVSTIIIFISSFLSKIGSIAIGIVTAAIVPVISQVVMAASHARATTGDSGINEKSYILNSDQVDQLLINELGEFVINGDSKIGVNSLIELDKRKKQVIFENSIGKFRSYETSNWYDKAAYVDSWYQLGGFYDMFLDEPIIGGDPQLWTVERTAAHISKEESLESTLEGNATVTVNIMTSKDIDPDRLVKVISSILLGQKKAIIASSGAPDIKDSIDYYITPSGKKAVMTWDDMETNSGYYISNSLDTNLFEGKPVIEFFTNSLFSFEDRLRAVLQATSTKIDSKTGKNTAILQSFHSLGLNEYLTYKLILAALREPIAIINQLYLMTTDPQTKLLIDAVKTSFIGKYTYAKPNHVFGMYQREKFINDLKSKGASPAKIISLNKLIDLYQPAAIIADGYVQLHTFHKPYINKDNTLIGWGILGAFMILITGIRYWRRDFK